MIIATYGTSDELYHHGIKGQKWGVRRFQNADGSLTPAGKKKFEAVQNSKSALRKRYHKNMAINVFTAGAKVDKRNAENSYKRSEVMKNKANVYEQKSKNTKNEKKSSEIKS